MRLAAGVEPDQDPFRGRRSRLVVWRRIASSSRWRLGVGSIPSSLRRCSRAAWNARRAFGLTAGAVEGQHRRCPQPLSHRFLDDEPFQLGHDAHVAGVERRPEPFLDGGEPELVESGPVAGEGVGVEIGGERAAPPSQRLDQHRRGGRRIRRRPAGPWPARRRRRTGGCRPRRGGGRARNPESGRPVESRRDRAAGAGSTRTPGGCCGSGPRQRPPTPPRRASRRTRPNRRRGPRGPAPSVDGRLRRPPLIRRPGARPVRGARPRSGFAGHGSPVGAGRTRCEPNGSHAQALVAAGIAGDWGHLFFPRARRGLGATPPRGARGPSPGCCPRSGRRRRRAGSADPTGCGGLRGVVAEQLAVAVVAVTLVVGSRGSPCCPDTCPPGCPAWSSSPAPSTSSALPASGKRK